MKQTYVALLRGINVGGNTKVEMKKLKKTFEDLKYTQVSTYINSGNVIFCTDQPKDSLVHTIENVIEKTFDLSIGVVIRNQKEIEKIIKSVPSEWSNNADQKTDVIFLWDEVNEPSVLGEILTNPKVDHLSYIDGAVIWHIDRVQYSQSAMHKFIGSRIYKQMTARNINTVRKLNKLMHK